MTRVAIALGSNVGDRLAHLHVARTAISQRIGPVVGDSSAYETAPIGGPEQGPFLNGVVVVDTDLEPRAVLDQALAIERGAGRERGERWGPRTLDLDIILFGDTTVDEPGLTIPHPRLAERRFVLEPLIEAWPGATMPNGTPIATYLDAVADQDVELFAPRIADEDSFEMGVKESVIVFITVGLLAVGIWWLLGLFL